MTKERNPWELIADKDISHLVFAFEAVLTEMRTHARGDRTIREWVKRLDSERDDFVRTMLERPAAEPRQIDSINPSSAEPRDERTVSATHPTGGPAFVHGIGATIESPARHITTVGGIESFGMTRGQIDTSVHLARCPFCGSQAGFHDSGRLDTKFNRWVECSNTSCGVRTPEHYQTREAAAEAWNRRDRNAAPEKKCEPRASRVGDLTASEAVRLFGGTGKPKSLHVPTWRERCATHPEHQNGAIVTSRMIEQRMQEEIDDLRNALEARR